MSEKLPKCIINGAVLVEDGRWVEGDLHIVGNTFVFNAKVVDNNPMWVYRQQLPMSAKSLIVDHPDATYEKRGIIVVHSEHAHLNDAAVTYMARTEEGRKSIPARKQGTSHCGKEGNHEQD